MGIQDRDYYRNDGRSYLGSLVQGQPVTVWLIAINVAVFFVQIVANDGLLARNPLKPPSWFDELFMLSAQKVFFEGQVWRLFTCAFLHASPWHILFNMLFLWWFGKDIEGIYGSKEYAAFYFAGILVSSLAYCGSALVGLAHTDKVSFALGASGAVTAVMVLFACHFPRFRMLLFFVLPVPIWGIVVFQVLSDFIVFVGAPSNGIAVAAHLGGAAFGAAYWLGGWRLMNWLPGWPKVNRRARPRLRVYRDGNKPAPVAVPVAAERPAEPADMDEQLEAQLDQVLAKVAEYGQASLTETERQILFRASEIYKRRRGR